MMTKEENWFEFVHDFIKNAPKMTEEAQRAIAKYLDYCSEPSPKIKLSDEEINKVLKDF